MIYNLHICQICLCSCTTVLYFIIMSNSLSGCKGRIYCIHSFMAYVSQSFSRELGNLPVLILLCTLSCANRTMKGSIRKHTNMSKAFLLSCLLPWRSNRKKKAFGIFMCFLELPFAILLGFCSTWIPHTLMCKCFSDCSPHCVILENLYW